MKVLLVTIGSHGDVHPFVGIGIELRRRGHEAMLITNDHFRPLAEQAGLEFAPLGTDEQFREMIKDPDLWHPWRAFEAVFVRGVLPILEATYRAVEANYVPGQTVAVASCLAMGARIAQEVLGIPTASAHTAPSILRTLYDNPKLPMLFMPKWFPKWLKRALWEGGDKYVLDPKLAPAINELRRKVGGLEPVSGIINLWWHSPQLVLGLWPDWYGPVQPDWPANTHPVGFPLYDEDEITPLSDELDAWLRADEPPIAFTPGSAMVHGEQFFAESAAACARLNRRGLLLTRHAEQVPRKLPPGVRYEPYAPFGALLPRCAAAVHHGGIGSTAQALRAGCPQLIMPMAHDQFDNAERITRLGVGRWLKRRAYTAPRVARSLHALLDEPEVKQACRTVSQKFANTNPIQAACEHLERFHRAQVPPRQLTRTH